VASLLGDFAAAEADLTAALGCGDATARLYFLRASVRDRLQNADGATADRAAGLARTPTDELSWVSRAEVRTAADPTAALADVEAALKLNPLSAPALQLKAHLLSEHLNRPDDALRVLDQVVTAYPDAAVFRAGRGVMLARRGQYEAARRDARDALLRDGKAPNLYQVGCILALTSADRRDDRAEAVRLVWQALKTGYGLEYVDTDPDLNPIRDDAEFARVVKAAKALHATSPAPPENVNR
jgi:tetratricopeptide (TPR) repeat protein